jgi:23S rRNA (uridine2552-2'-O)-methyltransferase
MIVEFAPDRTFFPDRLSMPKRTKSSAAWLAEHESDPYVKRAREEGWRSRAAFKLEEIHKQDRLLKPGMTIVDLGAAPGGWSQFAARHLSGKGRIIAMDILEMPAVPGVEFVQGDFNDDAVLERLLDMVGPAQVDLVMSDIAPNMMGIADVDHDRSMQLVELAADFACRTLRPGGDFLAKVFQGRGFQPLLAQLRERFESVKLRKPKASRARSAEVYVLARGYRLV